MPVLGYVAQMNVRVALMLGCGLAAGCVASSPEPSGATDGVGDSGGSSEADDGGTDGSTVVDTTSGSTGAGSSDTGTGCIGSCESTGNPDPTTSRPTQELDCHDGIDDDGDGAFDCLDDDCWNDDECAARSVRVATWNVLQLGAVGSPEHDQMIAVVRRIDADVLCLQEVGDDEDAALTGLADVAGYETVVVAPAQGATTGMIRNACLSRLPLAGSAVIDAEDISPDPSANDLTRPFVRLRLEVPAADRYLSIFAAHLKSGETSVDRFRRMVEAVRLGQAVEQEQAMFPNNAVVAFGDFNEVPDAPDDAFASVPGGLPLSYALGTDIALPLSYEPFAPMDDAGLARVHARVEDQPWTATYLPGLVRLDYIYQAGGEVVVAEAYEACEDDGVDDSPFGDVLPKAGEPLACGASADASDHRPVVAVLYFGQ